MKYISLLFLTFLFFQTTAQENDIFGVLAEANKKQEVIDDVNSIVEYTYQQYNLAEKESPDTVIEHNGEKVELYLNTTNNITLSRPPKKSKKRLIIMENIRLPLLRN